MMRMGAFFTGMASRNPYKGRAADPLAKLEQRAEDDTRKMLAAIQRNIVRLRGVVAGAKDPQQLRVRDKLYREVYAAYAELGGRINDILKGGVENAAMLSAEAVGKSLVEKGLGLVKFSLERARRYWRYICPENGRSLAATMTDKMSEDLVETLRRATVEVERQAAVEGWTRDEIRKAIEDRWAEISKDDRNFKFVDKSGRAWENGRYCQMLARTTATRVWNDSFLDRLAEEGFNLVRVSSHGSEPDCDICRAWGGKICVISGKGDKYPTVEDARAAGVFHPNCMCTWEYVDEDEDKAEIEKQALKAGEKVDWSDPEAVEKARKGEKAKDSEAPETPKGLPPGAAEWLLLPETARALSASLGDKAGDYVLFKPGTPLSVIEAVVKSGRKAARVNTEDEDKWIKGDSIRAQSDKSRDNGKAEVVTTPEPFKLEKSLEPSPELAKFMADAGIARQTEPLDLSVTNPGFKDNSRRLNNCTHCVVAAFLRLNGYDVEATPTSDGEMLDGSSLWKDKRREMLDSTSLTSDIFSKMTEWGDGAIAQVRIPTSPTYPKGHVFLALNVAGEVSFYDPQVGNSDNCYVSILNAPDKGPNAETGWIMRIDNNELDEKASNCFRRSRR